MSTGRASTASNGVLTPAHAGAKLSEIEGTTTAVFVPRLLPGSVPPVTAMPERLRQRYKVHCAQQVRRMAPDARGPGLSDEQRAEEARYCVEMPEEMASTESDRAQRFERAVAPHAVTLAVLMPQKAVAMGAMRRGEAPNCPGSLWALWWLRVFDEVTSLLSATYRLAHGNEMRSYRESFRFDELTDRGVLVTLVLQPDISPETHPRLAHLMRTVFDCEEEEMTQLVRLLGQTELFPAKFAGGLYSDVETIEELRVADEARKGLQEFDVVEMLGRQDDAEAEEDGRCSIRDYNRFMEKLLLYKTPLVVAQRCLDYVTGGRVTRALATKRTRVEMEGGGGGGGDDDEAEEDDGYGGGRRGAKKREVVTVTGVTVQRGMTAARLVTQNQLDRVLSGDSSERRVPFAAATYVLRMPDLQKAFQTYAASLPDAPGLQKLVRDAGEVLMVMVSPVVARSMALQARVVRPAFESDDPVRTEYALAVTADPLRVPFPSPWDLMAVYVEEAHAVSGAMTMPGPFWASPEGQSVMVLAGDYPVRHGRPSLAMLADALEQERRSMLNTQGAMRVAASAQGLFDMSMQDGAGALASDLYEAATADLSARVAYQARLDRAVGATMTDQTIGNALSETTTRLLNARAFKLRDPHDPLPLYANASPLFALIKALALSAFFTRRLRGSALAVPALAAMHVTAYALPKAPTPKGTRTNHLCSAGASQGGKTLLAEAVFELLANESRGDGAGFTASVDQQAGFSRMMMHKFIKADDGRFGRDALRKASGTRDASREQIMALLKTSCDASENTNYKTTRNQNDQNEARAVKCRADLMVWILNNSTDGVSPYNLPPELANRMLMVELAAVYDEEMTREEVVEAMGGLPYAPRRLNELWCEVQRRASTMAMVASVANGSNQGVAQGVALAMEVSLNYVRQFGLPHRVSQSYGTLAMAVMHLRVAATDLLCDGLDTQFTAESMRRMHVRSVVTLSDMATAITMRYCEIDTGLSNAYTHAMIESLNLSALYTQQCQTLASLMTGQYVNDPSDPSYEPLNCTHYAGTTAGWVLLTEPEDEMLNDGDGDYEVVGASPALRLKKEQLLNLTPLDCDSDYPVSAPFLDEKGMVAHGNFDQLSGEMHCEAMVLAGYYHVGVLPVECRVPRWRLKEEMGGEEEDDLMMGGAGRRRARRRPRARRVDDTFTKTSSLMPGVSVLTADTTEPDDQVLMAVARLLLSVMPEKVVYDSELVYDTSDGSVFGEQVQGGMHAVYETMLGLDHFKQRFVHNLMRRKVAKADLARGKRVAKLMARRAFELHERDGRDAARINTAQKAKRRELERVSAEFRHMLVIFDGQLYLHESLMRSMTGAFCEVRTALVRAFVATLHPWDITRCVETCLPRGNGRNQEPQLLHREDFDTDGEDPRWDRALRRAEEERLPRRAEDFETYMTRARGVGPASREPRVLGSIARMACESGELQEFKANFEAQEGRWWRLVEQCYLEPAWFHRHGDPADARVFASEATKSERFVARKRGQRTIPAQTRRDRFAEEDRVFYPALAATRYYQSDRPAPGRERRLAHERAVALARPPAESGHEACGRLLQWLLAHPPHAREEARERDPVGEEAEAAFFRLQRVVQTGRRQFAVASRVPDRAYCQEIRDRVADLLREGGAPSEMRQDVMSWRLPDAFVVPDDGGDEFEVEMEDGGGDDDDFDHSSGAEEPSSSDEDEGMGVSLPLSNTGASQQHRGALGNFF